MGRHKTHRDIPLYTRVTKENDKFLAITCKKAKMNKTAWLDSHFNFLRSTGKDVHTQIAKTRD